MDMEEEETVSIPSRKELRKQKLMEYLTAKGKLPQLNHKSRPPGDCQVKKTLASSSKFVPGKENKAPSDAFKYGAPKGSALASQSKVNEKGRVLTGRQNIILPSVTSIPAKPKPNQNHVLARMQPSVSSRSKLNASSQLKKQPNAGSSCRVSSNPAAHITTVTKSNSRFSSSSNATVACLMKDVRMSLGPLVKTKTGLIPAVTQTRSSQSQKVTSTTAAVATITTSVANKVRASTLPLVSKRSDLAQTKIHPVSGINHPGNEKTTIKSMARNGLKVQDQSKSNSKPFLGKHSQPLGRNQLSSGLKSTSSFPKRTAAPVKPEGRVGMSNTTKSTGQNADKFTRQRTEGKREKDGQQYRADPRASGKPASRCSSRAVSGIQSAAVAQVGGKTKKAKEADGVKRHTSVNPPPPQTGLKRTVAPVVSRTMSKTVPQPMRTISFTGQAAAAKTTKIPVRIIPQTEGKKLTAVQEERMRKLQEWREAKGISYKRPPMQVKPQAKRTVAVPQPFWAAMKEEDEAQSLISAVDRSLADCIKLLGEGCPPDQVKSVLSRLPAVSQKFAKYWICQARLMEQEGNRDVLPMFEEAVSVVVEPVDELRTVVFEILKKKDEIQASDEKKKGEEQTLQSENTSESIMDPLMTPKPVRALICGEKGNSSVVKYKITATPGGPQSQRKEPAQVNGREIHFFTPVRRSVRIERASLRYPASLQDHDLCVASYHDLMSRHKDEEECGEEDCESRPATNKTPMYVYRQNEALQDKVSVQLVYDDV